MFSTKKGTLVEVCDLSFVSVSIHHFVENAVKYCQPNNTSDWLLAAKQFRASKVRNAAMKHHSHEKRSQMQKLEFPLILTNMRGCTSDADVTNVF